MRSCLRTQFDAAIQKSMSRRVDTAVARLQDLESRIRERWGSLTSVQKRVLIRLLNKGGSLGVPEECARRTARALVRHDLCTTWAANEFGVDGPYVFIALREYEDTPTEHEGG